MQIKVINPDHIQNSKWSGGETSQYYIYPEDSSYKERNFKFRLSMAVAFDEISTYTMLPNVTRYLISLENVAYIQHKDAKPTILEPFGNIDCFMGDVETTAVGGIRDFNLMLANGATGVMKTLANGRHTFSEKYSHIALFFDKEAKVKLYDKIYDCDAKSVLLFSDITQPFEVLISSTNTAIILCKVNV